MTIATLTDLGKSFKKALAASCAATNRLGLTSVTRMLKDTSIAKTIVLCVAGRAITANGREAASRAAAMASRNSSGGRCWRQRAPPRPSVLSPLRPAKWGESFFLRCNILAYAATRSGNTNNSHSHCGHMSQTVDCMSELLLFSGPDLGKQAYCQAARAGRGATHRGFHEQPTRRS